LTSRVEPQNQPQQNVFKFDVLTNPKWKTIIAGRHDAEKDPKTSLTAQSTWKLTTSPVNQAFTHGAILFFLSQPSLSHNTARSYFLWNNVEKKYQKIQDG